MNKKILSVFSLFPFFGFVHGMHLAKSTKHRIGVYSRKASIQPTNSTKRTLFGGKKKSAYEEDQCFRQHIDMRCKLRVELDSLNKELSDFKIQNELMFLQLKIDAKRDELNKLKSIKERVLAGETVSDEVFDLIEITYYNVHNHVPHKVDAKNLIPVLNTQKEIGELIVLTDDYGQRDIVGTSNKKSDL